MQNVTLMRRLLARGFSGGRLLGGLARGLGWSPVGRTILFRDVEGPLADWLSGRTGLVVGEDGDQLRIEVDGNSSATAPRSAMLMMTPRHSGWTGQSLLFTPVAFVVRDADAAGGDEIASIATVSLSRA
jgi:hypothetical protein